MLTYIKGRTPSQWLAAVAGALMAYQTARIVTGGNFNPMLWNEDQWIAMTTLVGTILMALIMDASAEKREYGRAIAFGVLFFAGTGLTIWNSVGGQHMRAAYVSKSIENGNDAVRSLREDVRRTKAELEKKQLQMDSYAGVRTRAEIAPELNNIVGKAVGKVPPHIWRRTANCNAATEPDSIRACEPAFRLRDENGKAGARDLLALEIDGLNKRLAEYSAQLRATGGEKPVETKAKPIAEIFALAGYDRSGVEYALLLIVPFCVTLFLEFGTIFSFKHAFAIGGGDVDPTPPGKSEPVPTPVDGPKTDHEAQVIQLYRNGNGPNQAALARMLGMHPATASRMLRDMEKRGLINRVADGKQKRAVAR